MATMKNPPSTVMCSDSPQDFGLDGSVVQVLVRNRDAVNSVCFNLKTSASVTSPSQNGNNAIVLKAGQEERLEANGNANLSYVSGVVGQTPVLEITQFVQIQVS